MSHRAVGRCEIVRVRSAPAASQYSEYSAPRPGCGVAGVAGCWMLLDVHILWYHRNPSQTQNPRFATCFNLSIGVMPTSRARFESDPVDLS